MKAIIIGAVVGTGVSVVFLTAFLLVYLIIYAVSENKTLALIGLFFVSIVTTCVSLSLYARGL